MTTVNTLPAPAPVADPSRPPPAAVNPAHEPADDRLDAILALLAEGDHAGAEALAGLSPEQVQQHITPSPG